MTVGLTRIQNRARVLQEVARHGAVSRSDIAAQLSLTPASVSRIVAELIEMGLLEEAGERTAEERPGRRRVEIRFARDGGYVIGLSLEAYEQSAVVADLSGKIMASRNLHVEGCEKPGDALELAAAGIEELIDEAAVPESRILGISVAVVGVLDHESGIVSRSPFFAWMDTDAQSYLQQRLRLPVHVDNHLNATTLLEVEQGAGRDATNIILVRAALALAASIYSEGSLVRGRSGSAGQIGHGPVGGVDRLCRCGRKGCLDTVASGWAILESLGEITLEDIVPTNFAKHGQLLTAVLDRADNGDEIARNALFEAGKYLGASLCVLGAALSPERIVLMGPVGQQADYQRGVRNAVEANYFSFSGQIVDVAVSRVTSEAAAVNLGLREFVLSDRLDLTRLVRSVEKNKGAGSTPFRNLPDEVEAFFE